MPRRGAGRSSSAGRRCTETLNRWPRRTTAWTADEATRSTCSSRYASLAPGEHRVLPRAPRLAREAAEAVAQQRQRVGVAGGLAGLAEHALTTVTPLRGRRADEHVAGGVRVARLHAVDPRDSCDERVAVDDGALGASPSAASRAGDPSSRARSRCAAGPARASRGRRRSSSSWPSSRPIGFAKCVSRSPSCSASAFISAHERGASPTTPTASVTAASLALGSSSPRRRSRDRHALAGAQPDLRLDGAGRSRRRVNTSSRSARSSVSSAVMSFVVDAIGRASARVALVGRRRPCSASTRIADCAPRSCGPDCGLRRRTARRGSAEQRWPRRSAARITRAGLSRCPRAGSAGRRPG